MTTEAENEAPIERWKRLRALIEDSEHAADILEDLPDVHAADLIVRMYGALTERAQVQLED